MQSTGAVTAAIPLLLPVSMLSSAYLPDLLMPAWLRWAASGNPYGYVVDAVRTFTTAPWHTSAQLTGLLAAALAATVTVSAAAWRFHRLISTTEFFDVIEGAGEVLDQAGWHPGTFPLTHAASILYDQRRPGPPASASLTPLRDRRLHPAMRERITPVDFPEEMHCCHPLNTPSPPDFRKPSRLPRTCSDIRRDARMARTMCG